MRAIKVRTRSTFIKRHSRLITFFGALVVFCTFVVKEAIRDEIKETVDAQQISSIVFVLSANNEETQKMLSAMAGNIDGLVDAIGPRPKSPEKRLENDMRLLFRHIVAITDQTKRVLELSTPLLDHLSKPDRERFYDLDHRLGEFQERESVVTKDMERADFLNKASGGDKMETLVKSNSSLIHDADEFPALMLDKFGKVQEHEVRLYKRWTFASYFLFAAGWVLALVGRIYGDVAVADSE